MVPAYTVGKRRYGTRGGFGRPANWAPKTGSSGQTCCRLDTSMSWLLGVIKKRLAAAGCGFVPDPTRELMMVPHP